MNKGIAEKAEAQKDTPEVEQSIAPKTEPDCKCHKNPETPEPEGWLYKFLRVIAFPTALLSGFMVSRTEVRGSAFREGLSDGTMKDIVETNQMQRAPLVEARKLGTITQEEFVKRSGDVRKMYRAAADARMEYMGFGSFLKKLSYVPRSAAQKAIIDGMAVTGITLGVLLTLADSRLLSHFKDKDQGRE